MADIDDDDGPKHWADLPKHEREALIDFARLSETHRARIYKAGANIAFWDSLAEKFARWKVLWVGVALVVGWVTGLVDLILSFRPGSDE